MESQLVPIMENVIEENISNKSLGSVQARLKDVVDG